MDSFKHDKKQQQEHLHIHTVPLELVELAAQVKAILAQYSANDSAVCAIRRSEAYRRVAHLIEAPLVPWQM